MQIRFRFRPDTSIGEAPAELDPLLENAFVETGAFDTIRTRTQAKSVIVGRTGAGKTALLLRLERNGYGRVLRVDPASLALSYVTNSNIIPGLVKQDVNFHVFYRHLWRHILVTELLRDIYDLQSPEKWDTMVARLVGKLGSNSSKSARRRRVLDHYRKRNPTFWEDADVRAREIVQSLEGQVGAALGAGPTAELKAGKRISEQLVPKVQRVVTEESINSVQDAFDLLQEEAESDEQKRYFVVIDDLDKNWVEAEYAYDLIAALLDVIGDFARIPSKNVKVVIALRQNMVDQLLKRPAQQRQQREKYEALFYRLHWTRNDLVALANKRLAAAVRGEYGKPVTLDTLLPSMPPSRKPRSRAQTSTTDYLVRRTFSRPRDLILLVNRCLEAAALAGADQIHWSHVRQAVRVQSSERLRSLCDEWADNFPGLDRVFDVFVGMRDRFTLEEIDEMKLLDLASAGESVASKSDMAAQCHAMLLAPGASVAPEDVARWLLMTLYHVGAVGMKNATSTVTYSYERDIDPRTVEITAQTKMYFHPALYDALRVRDPADDDE